MPRNVNIINEPMPSTNEMVSSVDAGYLHEHDLNLTANPGTD